MIFDKFCGLVERHFNQFEKLVRQAKIFNFPAIPHEVLPRGIDMDFFGDNFFLPYQVVVVEDKASMILLVDKSSDISGLFEERFFIECLPLYGDWNNYGDEDKFSEKIKQDCELYSHKYKDKYVVTYGLFRFIRSISNEKGYVSEGLIYNSWVSDKEKIISIKKLVPFQEELDLVSKATLRNACTAIEEIIYFNTPNRFILEESPISIKKSFSKSGKKILRSNDRPIYTLLKPKEIREKLGIHSKVNTEVGTKEGHYRRRHYRTFKSDVFVKVKGKTIIIPAVWIGPSEVERGNRRYKVMLNL